MKQDNIYAGLDIGTTKICAVIGRKNNDDSLDIIGLGCVPSSGLRKGVVINIDGTVKAIIEALREAERMAGVQVKNVCAGIAGGHVKSFNSRGIIAVKNREVSRKDVERAIESASAVDVPIGSEVLHVIPQQFILDGQTEIKDPIGMNGVRLEVDVHIVTGAVSSAQNILKSCERAGISVDDIVLEQLASSEAVLSEDEKEIGVCLIDGGGGTTDMAVYKRNAVYHTAVLSIGGNNFTRDLSIGLNTPESEAEKVKKEHGCVWMDFVSEDEVINVPSVGGRPPRKISRPVLTQILQARSEEIFQMFLGELQKKQLLEILGAGIVVTGGISNLEGIEYLASSIFEVPVRVGRPQGIGGLTDIVENPVYATGVGLTLHAAKKGHQQVKISRGSDEKVFRKVLDRMKSWFGEFF
ncbi:MULTISPECIES: cell division protein FtsA [Flexistipes]|uniref:Cell division protein FtsA n=1 Tax=Flexistipes sinusarabici (strain ATCC 49648 / DSM 4947 / MAS 10) TaxID=717231 RepID=F8E9J3_FLESM|nr:MULTISPECIES: cell division protein FtsA [Flexistipes]AEI15322.1 cell division protein FtsA [Flexistipes sinusarabici DSM 4947]MEC9492104.1 cell division protein FtsA [Flexistipes sp.]